MIRARSDSLITLGDYPEGNQPDFQFATWKSGFFYLEVYMTRRCLSIREAAEYLSISPKTLSRHKEITPIKIGHLTRYDKEMLDDYITKLSQEAITEVAR